MSRSYLSELETGQKDAPSADTVIRIAAALGVPIEAISYPEPIASAG
jgi:transcriptional regulator with XRE-family HTH domain